MKAQQVSHQRPTVIFKETASEKATADSEGCASMDSRHLSPSA